MLTRGTPSARLASELVRAEKHSILFTGYLDPEELGYELAYAKLGDKLCFNFEASDFVEIRCPHGHRFSLSSHADRDALITVAEQFEPDIVVWVHGDPAATEWLRKTFSVRNSKARSIRPVNGETIVLRD